MSNLFPQIRKLVISHNTQQVRWLPRWSHRRPIGVIPAEEYAEKEDKPIKKLRLKSEPERPRFSDENSNSNYAKINWKQPKPFVGKNAGTESLIYNVKQPRDPKPLTIMKKKIQKTPATIDMLEMTIDAEGNFIYTKMKNNDSRIGIVLTEIKSKKEKENKDLILLEGKRLIQDALEAGCKLEYILFSRMKEVEALKPFLPKIGAKLFKMPYREMQMWSDLTTTPGIMGIFKIPNTEMFTPKGSLPLTIICDNIREPNNLGAILRTCSGVGCEQLIMTRGCVDVWNTKVLRSASGAHFKLHMKKKLHWNEIRDLLDEDCDIYIADNNTITSNIPTEQSLSELVNTLPVLPYYGVDFNMSKNIVLIIGGETEGVSDESFKLASEFGGVRLNVPLSNNVNSLNTGTALGIIAFEIKRQLSVLSDSQEKIKKIS